MLIGGNRSLKISIFIVNKIKVGLKPPNKFIIAEKKCK